jgi:hypothetical protein
MAYENHWLPGFNFNVEEWDAKGQTYETLAICRSIALCLRDADCWNAEWNDKRAHRMESTKTLQVLATTANGERH